MPPINLATYAGEEAAAQPPPPEQAAPAPGPINLATYEEPAPTPAPIATEAPPPAGLPPAQTAEPLPAPQPQGQGPLDRIPVVGGWLQDRVDDVTQPGGTFVPAAREYRPVPAGTQPIGAALGQDRYAGVQPAIDQGDVKGAAGAAFEGNWGDIDPSRAAQLTAQARNALREIDPALADDLVGPAPQQPDLAAQAAGVYADVPVLDAFTAHIRQNPEVYRQIATDGWMSPEGIAYQGERAMYEYFQSGQSGVQRLGTDIVQAPVSTLADVAATALTVGAYNPVTKGAAVNVARRGLARGLDALGTVGLSEAIPGTLKGLGAVGRKTGLLAPSGQAVAQRARQEVSEKGAALLQEARLGGVAPEPSMLSEAAPGITRLATPGGVDLAYDVDPTVGIRVYDDPANPAVYRTPTETDFGAVMGAMRELNQQERAIVSDPWFRYGMNARDAAGNDLLDPLAPELPGGIRTGRNLDAHRRWVEDRAAAIRRFDDPAGNRPVLGRLLQDWERTFYGRGTHPLTGRTEAEHRLQAIRNVLKEVPEHDDVYAQRQLRRMEAQLAAPPGSIGSRYSVVKGRPVPYSPGERDYLRELASTYSESFWKGKLPSKRRFTTSVNAVFVDPKLVRKGLLDNKKPPPRAGASRQNAYENWVAVATARLSNPVLVRSDVGAMRDRLRSAAGRTTTTALRQSLDGIKDVLERNGIVPGASSMPDADVQIALSQWLKATPAFSVEEPPGGWSLTPAPLGAYTPGSVDEALRLALDDSTRSVLDAPYEVNGVVKKPWQSLLAEQSKLAAARAASQAQLAGRALDARAARELSTTVAQVKKLHKGYADLDTARLAAMPDDELDRLAAATVGEDVARAMGFDPARKGKLLAAYDGFNHMLRSLILYSPARGVVYPMMQLVGNLVTLGVANRGAIRYYRPTDWKAIKRFADDPELRRAPPAVALRQGMGLGRSANLGIVSRDQSLGIHTFFSDPDKHAMVRAVGKLVAPQGIKNWADAADTMHRHALWRAVAEPAYAHVKRELPAAIDATFAEARRRAGVPLPLGRDQIAAVVTSLQDASPTQSFTPAELREALLHAAGGPGAPNRRELFNAADRAARDYREVLVELDKAAMKEVNRVAFDPLETNLDAFLSRAILFSWWNTRAANLYAQEIAGSPIMLGLFSRAVLAGGQQNRMEGQSEGQQNWEELMRSPAGFVLATNPFTLSSSFLSMAGFEGSGKRDLTTLGELVETGFLGNNLFLAPLVKASLGMLGALGEDYQRQDLTGMRRIEQMLNKTAEFVNREIHQFYSTKGGNPANVPDVDFNFMQNIMHAAASGRLPGTQEAPPFDPQRAEQGQIAFYVSQRLLQENPELAVPDAEGNVYEFEQAMREVLQNPDSEIYQQAMDDYVAGLFPDATGQGGIAGVVSAIAKDMLIPLQFSVQPSARVDRWARLGRDAVREDSAIPGELDANGMPVVRAITNTPEKTPVDSAMGWLSIETEESRRYELAENAVYSSADPQQAALSDVYLAIKNGAVEGDVEVMPGVAFSPDALAAMSQDDRNAVANAWAATNGYDTNAYWERRDAALAENPELANGLGWKEWIAQYPGGPEAALDATAAVNPNVARWANDPENVQKRQENPDDFIEGIGWLGKLVAGIQDSRYDFPVDTTYAGVVGGLDGTVGAWYTDPARTGGGSDKVATVQEEVAEIDQTAAELDAFRPGAGAEYRANLAAGSKRPIPADAYGAGYRGPTDAGGWTGSWLAFSAANPEAGIEEWARWDAQEWAQERTLEVANLFAAGAYVAEAEATGDEVPEAAVVEEERAPQPAYLRPRQSPRRGSLSDLVFGLLGD